MDEYKIVSIEEGLTKIEFPEYEKVSSAAPVFYNPHMELKQKSNFPNMKRFHQRHQFFIILTWN